MGDRYTYRLVPVEVEAIQAGIVALRRELVAHQERAIDLEELASKFESMQRAGNNPGVDTDALRDSARRERALADGVQRHVDTLDDLRRNLT